MNGLKHILIFLLLSAALAGCQRVDDAVMETSDVDVFTAHLESFDVDTKTELNGSYAVWTSGDEIAIFQGNSIADRYLLHSLQSSAFRLAERAEGGNELSTNVAFYPYGESLECEDINGGYRICNVSFPSMQDFKKGSFAEESFLMVAVTDKLKDRVLDFKNICGGIRLRFQSIAGDTVSVRSIAFKGNRGEKLSGNADVIYPLENDVPSVEWAAEAQESITMEVNDFHLTDSTIAEIILAVPPQVFPDGFTVEIDAQVNGVDSLYCRPTMRPQEIRRSRILTMPVITFGEVIVHPWLSLDQDALNFGSSKGTQTLGVIANNEWSASANADWVSISPASGQGSDQASSVIITVTKNNTTKERTAEVTFVSEYLVKTVTITQAPKPYINISHYSLDFFCNGGSVAVNVDSNYDWEAWADVEWVNVSPSYGAGDGNPVSVKITASPNEGKSARSATVIFSAGNITKVIYVSQKGQETYIDEYGIDHGQGVKIGETVWAPVNCGYHATYFKYGKLYQWGRRYGQGYDSADSSVPKLVKGPVSLSTGQSKDNENKFYQSASSPWDWCSSQNDYLWNSGTEKNPVKTEYDPCPEGWRVPTYAELDELKNNYSSWTSVNNQSGRWFSGSKPYSSSVPRVFFPAAGSLYDLTGDADHRDDAGYYWSSRPDSSMASYLHFHVSTISMKDFYRASGYSVRCVKE